MKKSLSFLLAIAMVFGLFASVVSAAESTTELTAQQKFEALKDKGIFQGIEQADGTTVAGLDQEMTRAQFARIAALLMELEGIGNPDTKVVTEKPFSDVELGKWYTEEVAAVKEAGIMIGNGDGTFGTDDKIQVQQLAVVIAKILGLEEVKDATVEGSAAYAAGWIQAIINAGVDFPTNYTANATRAQLVEASFTAEAVLNPVAAKFSASQMGAKKIGLTFSTAVDSSKVKVTVSNGSNAVNYKSVTFADDKKSATVEFANNLLAADYTVKVEGAASDALTATVKVEASKVTKIEFPSDKLVMNRADTKKASLSYKVYNQFNEDVTSTNAVQVTSSKGTVVSPNSAGTIEVTSTVAFTVDEPVLITALHGGTSVFASVTAKAALPSRISAISIDKLDFADGKVLQEGATASDFKLLLNLKDQYGNSVTDVTYWAQDVAVTPSGTSVTLAATPTVSGGKVYLPLTAINAAGKTTITIVSLTTGNNASFAIDVKAAAKIKTLTLTAPSLAPKGETVEIPYQAFDQFGDSIKHPSLALTATGAGAGGTSVALVWDKDIVKDVTTLKLPINDTAGDTIVITGVTPAGELVQLSFSTVAKAVPTTISGVKDVNAALVGVNTDVNSDNLVIKDQYGRDIKLGTYGVKVATSGDAATTAATELPATFAAAKKGKLAVTLTLTKPASTEEVPNSAYTFDLNVVEKADITSYEASVAGTVYDGGALATYGKELKVTGLLADGTKVNIPYAAGANFKVDSTNSKVVFDGATSKISSVSHLDANKDEDVSVVVTAIGATGTQIIPVTVKVSSKASAVASLEVINNGIAQKVDTNYVAVAKADINAIGGLDQLVADAVKAVDQYGVNVSTTYTYSTYVTNLPSGKTVGTTVAGDIDQGGTFNVTVVTTNGQAIAFKVKVK